MTHSYRHKLLNWLCSVLLVSAFAGLNLAYDWFTTVPRLLEQGIPIDIGYLAEPIGESLIIYAVLFPVVLFWHFWDFVQQGTLVAGFSATLSKYRMFLMAFATASVILLAATLGLFDINSCDAIKEVMHSACMIIQPDWLAYSFFMTAGIALFLCVTKAVISIKSRFSKTI